MRVVLLMCLVMIARAGICQEIVLPTNADGVIEYIEVIPADSMAADKLYSRAKLYITDAFKSGKDVTQLVDDASKVVVGKGTMKVLVVKMLGMGWYGYVRFKINISSKDNRYKYSFSDFVLAYQGGTSQPRVEQPLEKDNPRTVSKKQWENVKEQVNEMVLLMIADLKKAMQKNEEW